MSQISKQLNRSHESKVLIPLDGSAFSAHIIPVITRLFATADTTLVLLRVAPPPHGIGEVAPPPLPEAWAYGVHPSLLRYEHRYATLSPAQVEESVRSSLLDELLAFAYRLEEEGYRVQTRIRFGDPAREIIDCAETEAADLVAMATHGRTGFKHFFLGSVAEYVLHHLHIPVILLHPTEQLSEHATTVLETARG